MEYPHAAPVLPYTFYYNRQLYLSYVYKKYTTILRVYIISVNSLGRVNKHLNQDFTW